MTRLPSDRGVTDETTHAERKECLGDLVHVRILTYKALSYIGA